MGTQQILIILLAVIIVGVATATGISVFSIQAMNSNRQAIISDMNYICSLLIAYYKTPRVSGGGEGLWDYDEIIDWLNMPMNRNGKRVLTQNGQVRIRVRQNGQKLVFVGYGYETGLDEEKAVRARLVLRGPNASPRLVIIN